MTAYAIDCRHHPDLTRLPRTGQLPAPGQLHRSHVPQFSHRDGSTLCWHGDGWAEPIEREAFRTDW
jgi:hypothetical protein